MTTLPHIDYIQPTPLALAVRDSMYPTEHKGLKKWLGVIAMIAIPMVAPAISASIGLSGAIGATFGSALTGATLGGLSAEATGGDWRRGALMGGISGGLAGYNAAPTAATNNTPVAGSNTISVSDGLGNIETVNAAGDTVVNLPGDPSVVNPAGGGLTEQLSSSFDTFASNVGEQFTSDKMAEKAVNAGLSMAGNALMDSGYTDEQKALIAKQQAEVERLEAQGAAVDKIKLQQAKQMLQQAMQVDPVMLARQKAAAAKAQQARATNQAVRNAGLTYGTGSGNRADSIKRKGAIEGRRGSSAAYDSGFLGGIDQKTKLQSAGLNALPASTQLSSYYSNLGNMYNDEQDRKQKELEGWGDLFGSSKKAVV